LSIFPTYKVESLINEIGIIPATNNDQKTKKPANANLAGFIIIYCPIDFYLRRIESKNSLLVLVIESLSIINSIASISPIS
jgi:hypothetical protein